MTNKKFYAVRNGNTTGIFTEWSECQEAIKGVSNVDYKSFTSEEEAKAFLDNRDIYFDKIQEDITNGYIVAYTDGSFDEKSNKYSYGAVIFNLENNVQELSGALSNPKFTSSRNVSGEIFGVLTLLDWAVSNCFEKIKIYYDYEGIEKWANKEWTANTEIAKTYIRILDEKYRDIIEINFQKVKGHSNNKYNEMADRLAKQALKSNHKQIKQGDNYYLIDGYSTKEIEDLIKKITDDFKDISVSEESQPNKSIYRLELDKAKLTISNFKAGKTLIQGKVSTLFQIFTTYLFESNNNVNVFKILGDAYKTTISYDKVDQSYEQLFSNLPTDYPPTMTNLLKQSIINSETFVESVEYSQYVFPTLRALEGHLKYLLKKNNICTQNRDFGIFNKISPGIYELPHTFTCTDDQRNNMEKCYNYLNANRHTLFHFGDIIGNTDDTITISSHEEAREIIKEVLTIISETI